MNAWTAEIRAMLFSLQDLDYQSFQSRLIPTVPAEHIIGVRTPQLRKYAKTRFRKGDWEHFLQELPHTYYEENMLHAFLIEQLQDFDRVVAELDLFLPYVDNWATCDSMSPPVFFKEREGLLPHLQRFLLSDHTYTVRYGIVGMMRHFLSDRFEPRFLEEMASKRSEEYYINMALAWYFATALAMQYSSTLPYIREHRLAEWVHEKTIQKACESYRLTAEQKTELKKYRKRAKI